MKKVQEDNELKFIILFGDKLYKFKTETEEEKNKWIKVLNSEINNLSRENCEKRYENLVEIKLKKKVIVDFYNLPKIQDGKDYIIKVTEEALLKEAYFKPKPKK
jgi:hypothetical protein